MAANVSFVEVESDKGHDAFLLDEPEFHATLQVSSTAPPNIAACRAGASDDAAAGSQSNGNGGRSIRVDLQLVADMVEPRSRVLDIGCGEGILLDYLNRFKSVDGRGMELSMAGVRAAVAMACR